MIRAAASIRIAFAVTFLVALAAGAGCTRRQQQSAIDRLRPCTTDEGPTDAYCGSLSVYENRKTQTGRTIDLKVVLLPGLSTDARPDPLFFLAGGPGQAAAQMARPLRDLFRRVQDDRDIVLVDQRGTGKSRPLTCRSDDDSLGSLDESDEAAFGRLRKCLEGYDADPRLYTTSIAMDDLDDVRAYLGYDRINLYGGSYGTRAALVYLRQHEPHVRAVILDGVAPPDMRLPLFFARDAQRAMDLLLADCEADEACRALHPNLAARLRALLDRLQKEPVKTRLVHPRTGVAADTTVKANVVASILFSALYSPLASSLIPALIERAERNDFQGMLALALSNDPGDGGIAIGMQLSIVCAEDVPRITPAEVERESHGTMFGPYLLESRMKACEFWPRGEVSPEYYQPVVSAVPALVLSGALDPVTPPTWGETVAKTLSNSRHLIAPGTGHGVMTTGCGLRLIREFLDEGSAQNLDDSCLKALKRPPFFLTPAGPDPTVSSGPAK